MQLDKESALHISADALQGSYKIPYSHICYNVTASGFEPSLSVLAFSAFTNPGIQCLGDLCLYWNLGM